MSSSYCHFFVREPAGTKANVPRGVLPARKKTEGTGEMYEKGLGNCSLWLKEQFQCGRQRAGRLETRQLFKYSMKTAYVFPRLL